MKNRGNNLTRLLDQSLDTNGGQHVLDRGDEFTTAPIGYWTRENMRLFMEEFAKSKNLNPHLPGTWYHAYRDFKKYKVGFLLFHGFIYLWIGKQNNFGQV